jgi:hypothetical protein
MVWTSQVGGPAGQTSIVSPGAADATDAKRLISVAAESAIADKTRRMARVRRTEG